MADKSGVYAIRNTVNGKMYIGSAINLPMRFRQHLKHLHAGVHHSVKLRRAWLKYGSAAFVFEVLQNVSHREQLLSVEQEWIDRFQSATVNGYNVCKTAGSPGLGMECSPETRAKLSRAGIGRKHSLEALAKMRGRICSSETCERMAAAKRGGRRSLEARARMSAAKIGQRQSPETRAKISAALSGCRRSVETRARMSIAQRGIGCSLVARAKISATKRAQFALLAQSAKSQEREH